MPPGKLIGRGRRRRKKKKKRLDTRKYSKRNSISSRKKFKVVSIEIRTLGAAGKPEHQPDAPRASLDNKSEINWDHTTDEITSDAEGT
jgi:hypothetical protein